MLPRGLPSEKFGWCSSPSQKKTYYYTITHTTCFFLNRGGGAVRSPGAFLSSYYPLGPYLCLSVYLGFLCQSILSLSHFIFAYFFLTITKFQIFFVSSTPSVWGHSSVSSLPSSFSSPLIFKEMVKVSDSYKFRISLYFNFE